MARWAGHAQLCAHAAYLATIGYRTSWSSRVVCPECHWIVVRYFTAKYVTPSLHEDLHPHPKYEMWVSVCDAMNGEHYGNVKVRGDVEVA